MSIPQRTLCMATPVQVALLPRCATWGCALLLSTRRTYCFWALLSEHHNTVPACVSVRRCSSVFGTKAYVLWEFYSRFYAYRLFDFRFDYHMCTETIALTATALALSLGFGLLGPNPKLAWDCAARARPTSNSQAGFLESDNPTTHLVGRESGPYRQHPKTHLVIACVRPS